MSDLVEILFDIRGAAVSKVIGAFFAESLGLDKIDDGFKYNIAVSEIDNTNDQWYQLFLLSMYFSNTKLADNSCISPRKEISKKYNKIFNIIDTTQHIYFYLH